MAAPRILLVDDQREVSQMLRSSLELSGWEYFVVDVPSGEEALVELGRGPVDLLVTDLVLPGISGLDLIHKFRTLNPEAHTIIITGHPSQEARKEAEALGVVAFLPKPLGTSLFLEAVASALRQRGKTQQTVQIPKEARARIKGCLDAVRLELKATASYLLDHAGGVILRSGKLEDRELETAFPPLMSASEAGLKVSRVIGAMLPSNMHYFQGEDYELYLCNVGALYGLAVAFEDHKGEARIRAVMNSGRGTSEELLDLLSRMETMEPDEVEPEIKDEEEQPESDEKIEPVDTDLKVAAEGIDRGEADAFWDQAVTDSKVMKEAEGDILTYDEALGKGLIPEDEEGEESGSDA